MRTTYSSFSFGSVPGSSATTFCESTEIVLEMHVRANSTAGKAKCGNGLPASASARISAKLWPVPAKNLSACCGVDGYREPQALDFVERGIGQAHGGHEADSRARPRECPWIWDSGWSTVPIAPAAFRYFQRSPPEGIVRFEWSRDGRRAAREIRPRFCLSDPGRRNRRSLLRGSQGRGRENGSGASDRCRISPRMPIGRVFA